MITARETPVSELPDAIAVYIDVEKFIEWDGYFDPVIDANQRDNLTGDPETHARICGVLDEWFHIDTRFNNGKKVLRLIDWWQNPTYLTENGGWRAWWLRAYLQVLRNGK